MNPSRIRSRNRNVRKAAAVVELAVCMPFVFLLVVGAVELSSGLMHQQVARLTVHDCAAMAAQGPTTCDDVQRMANRMLTQRGITEFDIEINEVPRTANTASVDAATVTQFLVPESGATTAGLDEVPRGTILRMTITATRPPISGFGLSFRFVRTDIVADCVFVKEI